jgi:hypothetical protein
MQNVKVKDVWIVLTYVSKSMSYKVSVNGSLTAFHIFVEAASAGFAGKPNVPVADATAAEATVVPACN